MAKTYTHKKYRNVYGIYMPCYIEHRVGPYVAIRFEDGTSQFTHRGTLLPIEYGTHKK